MAAIISEKFRIFNAKQFLESLSEASATNMYFFVGRPQKWYAYLEIYNVSGTFAVGETVTGGGLSGTVQEVHPNSLLIATTNATAAPAAGMVESQPLWQNPPLRQSPAFEADPRLCGRARP